jgi:hypothetical protein
MVPAIAAGAMVTSGSTGDGPFVGVVGQLYVDLLGRRADAGGLNGFASQIFQGAATRQQIAAALINSPEGQTHALNGLYQRLLGRAIDSSGLQSGLAFLAAGGKMEQIEAVILGSAEYFARKGGGSNSGFLAALYQDVLGRAIDPSGAKTFGQQLAAGVPAATVAAQVLQSLESNIHEVQGLYQQLLGRAADPGGLNGFVGDLQAGASNEDVASIIAGSAEYAGRHGGNLNAAFTNQVFEDLLGRPMDAATQANFAAQPDLSPADRAGFVQTVINSPEYRDRVVRQLYQQILGRDADPTGLQGGVTFLSSGGTYDQLKAFLLASDEYMSRHGGTNAGFLAALYQDALGRKIDASGAKTFGDALAGGASRASVVQSIVTSSEGMKVEAQEIYMECLGRGVDPSGLQSVMNALHAGASRENLIGVLMNSLEYTTRL